MVDRDTEGMALVLALLLLLALTALSHGTLVLARREMQTSWAFRHARGAEEASEAALRLASGEPSAFRAERPLWERRLVVSGETGDGLGYRGFVRWLDPEFFLLEGWGTSRGWDGTRRSTWVGWSLAPVARIAAFEAAVEIGGTVNVGSPGLLDVDDPTAVPEGWTALDCDGYTPVMDSLLARGNLRPWGPLGDVEGPSDEDDAPGPMLGLLTLGELLERSGAERSSSDGEREPPYVPSSPDSVTGCPGAGEPAFRGFDGSLTLEGGRVCGLLVVAGDLRLRGNATLQGLALVGGSLAVEESAGVEGMAQVGGDLLISSGGRFAGSLCSSLRALSGIDVLLDPVVLRRGRRLGAY